MLIQHCLKKVIIVWYDSHKEHHTLSLLQNTTSLAAVSTRKQCDCAVLIFSYINPRKRIIPVRNYRFITLSTKLYEELITMICGLKQHGAAGEKKWGFCSVLPAMVGKQVTWVHPFTTSPSSNFIPAY